MTTVLDDIQSSPSLSNALRSEWIKIRSVRSTVITLGVMIILGIGISDLASLAGRAAVSRHAHHIIQPVSQSLSGMLLAQIVIGVLGVLAFTGEISSNTIKTSVAATPNRTVLLTAKLITFSVISVVVSEVIAFVCFFTGQAIMSGPIATASLSQTHVLGAVAGTGLFVALLSVFALSLGVIIRRSAGAISAFVGIYLVLPLLVAPLPSPYSTDISKFLPFNIARTLTATAAGSTSTSFSPLTGFLLVALYTAIVVGVAYSLLNKRDV
jgi:ABC-type transport system involved in multi-copper enzyme maturation permease subunit